ncbi:hypothetical protein CALVIDRAFT_601725 [Calocera viscosa TUFC12733]|uniref:Uncharacterized protein n=1 Tax=Calocera viscosa (strain TUFC12733) TaxID=1330018 RepID=A0A167I1W5_CALVF|nr:hypothetical protein CALVIDRAFT_601725 [Calocera viscosa TUFC12733]
MTDPIMAASDLPHAPFIPNTLYIAVFSRTVDNIAYTNLGMLFCAVTHSAGTYFIAQQRPADGKWILNMTSTYPPDISINGWFPISNRAVAYWETTSANGKVNGVRRDYTTEESWLWTARLLKEFAEAKCIDWDAAKPIILPRIGVMSSECQEQLMAIVPNLKQAIGRRY